MRQTGYRIFSDPSWFESIHIRIDSKSIGVFVCTIRWMYTDDPQRHPISLRSCRVPSEEKLFLLNQPLLSFWLYSVFDSLGPGHQIIACHVRVRYFLTHSPDHCETTALRTPGAKQMRNGHQF